MTTLFTSKLGKTSAGLRSRIWIDGKRLIAAGFTPGQHYVATWTPATLTLTINPQEKSAAVAAGGEIRRVSGREGGKPIIDVVGQRVIDTFGKHCERVSVSYGDGVITIRRSK